MSFSPVISADDDAHDGADREDEQQHEEHGDDDEVHRVQLRALVIGALAHAEEAGEHGLHGVEEGSALHQPLHQLFPPRPATSKNVYDSAMLVTSAGSFGSTTKVTGMRRVSPGASVCCVKQKHSIFLKYSAALGGP